MVLYLDLLVSALILLIAGLVIHSFIIVINVNDWWNGRSVTPMDQVVTSLGVSRMCVQCGFTIYLFVITLFLKSLHFRTTLVTLDLIYAFFNYANFWLTSLLSIVFCLKISTLHTRLFLYLRRMIEQRTSSFIITAILLSILNCLLPSLAAITEVTNGGTYNTTMSHLLKTCSFVNSLYAHAVGIFPLLLFLCISSVLVFCSLYHHIRRMKMSGNLSINLETYYSAMKFVSITFMYNTIYFTGHFVGVLYYYLYCVRSPWLHIVLGFLPALHSSYLIYRTTKLRRQMSKVLQNVMDFLFPMNDPETREEIEIVAQ